VLLAVFRNPVGSLTAEATLSLNAPMKKNFAMGKRYLKPPPMRTRPSSLLPLPPLLDAMALRFPRQFKTDGRIFWS
jgi:hypothetical protein